MDLSDAIERALDSAPYGSLLYRGVDVSECVSRELYFALLNNTLLARAYRDQREGRRVDRFAVGTRAEGRAVRELHGPRTRLTVAYRSGGTWLRQVRRMRTRMPRDTSRSDWDEDRIGTGRLLFLIHSPKFLRYAQPLLSRTERPLVVLTAGGLDAWSSDLDAPVVPLAAFPVASGSASRELRDREFLLSGFNRLASALARFAPRGVVVFEGSHPLDEVGNRLAKERGIPCFCIQHGWSPIVHNGFRRMTYDRMLVWGEGFGELLRDHNPGLAIVAAGNIGLDGIEARPPTRPTVAFFPHGVSPLVSQAHEADFLDLACVAAAEFSQVEIVLREHPDVPLTQEWVTRLSAFANVRFAPPARVRLADVLKTAHVSVSIYSSAILESASLLVPPIIYNRTSLPRYSPDLDALGAGIEVRDRPSALATLERLLRDPTARKRLEPGLREVRQRFFAGMDGRAVARVVECLETVASP
ncbi:MAG: hypothetical protein ACYDCH_13835 [Gaiellaceae bacterium]